MSTVPEVLAICCGCKKKDQPHFVRKGKRGGQMLALCKVCRKARSLEYYRKQWAASPEYRERMRLKKQKIREGRDLRAEGLATDPVKVYVRELLAGSKYRAKRDGVAHSISKPWLIAQLKLGCAATGLPFVFARGTKSRCQPRAPSLDRIDTSKGYSEENSQVVMVWYNVAKNDYVETEILGLMQAVTERAVKRPVSSRDRLGDSTPCAGP